VQSVRPQQKQYLVSFEEYGLQSSAVLSNLSLIYMSTHISFPSSVVRCCLYREIYSGGSLGDRTSPITRLFFDSATIVYTSGSQTVCHETLVCREGPRGVPRN
jgi:hypothetical protein